MILKKLLVFVFAATTFINTKAQSNEAVTAYIQQYKQLAIDEMVPGIDVRLSLFVYRLFLICLPLGDQHFKDYSYTCLKLAR